jgi:hypothetical protein
MVLSWFRAAAALDPRGASTDAYRKATEALHELAEAQNMVDRASRIYHSAIASGLVTQQEADALWNDSAAASAKIEELRGSDQYWSPLVQEAVSLHYELQAMPAGDAEPSPADPPPADEGDGDGPRAGKFERYLEAKGEAPLLEPDPAPHPADDDEPRMSIPGPVI